MASTSLVVAPLLWLPGLLSLVGIAFGIWQATHGKRASALWAGSKALVAAYMTFLAVAFVSREWSQLAVALAAIAFAGTLFLHSRRHHLAVAKVVVAVAFGLASALAFVPVVMYVGCQVSKCVI